MISFTHLLIKDLLSTNSAQELQQWTRQGAYSVCF